eukprot:1157111-Pelagomonas_calceolata.AAC.1
MKVKLNAYCHARSASHTHHQPGSTYHCGCLTSRVANDHATEDKGSWDSGFAVHCCTPAQCSTALILFIQDILSFGHPSKRFVSSSYEQPVQQPPPPSDYLVKGIHSATVLGTGNSPYINQGKGDILAQKSRESPPPQSYKKKILIGIWRFIGSTRLHNLAARSLRALDKTLNSHHLDQARASAKATLPKSMKEKVTHWLKRAVSPHHIAKEKTMLVGSWRVTGRQPAPEPGCKEYHCFQ